MSPRPDVQSILRRFKLWTSALRKAHERKPRSNFRAHVTRLGLETVATHVGNQRLLALEIGCMFREAQGLSTYEIARFAGRAGESERFVSIDCDAEHIEAAKEIIERKDPSLLSRVRFLCGESLQRLPRALEALGHVDFALIDGSGHPEICLREFEMILGRLSDSGLILVDDLQEFAPTEAYPDPRPFGKGTLILAYLVIGEYLARPKHDFAERPYWAGSFVEQTRRDSLVEIMRGYRYSVLGKGNHKILAVGPLSVLTKLESRLQEGVPDGIQISPRRSRPA